METMRSPSFLTPFSRSSQALRTTGILGFLDPRLVHALGDVGLEDPHGAAGLVERLRALALVAVLLALLPAPGFGLVVVLPDAMVELAGKAADDGLVAGVGPAQPAGGEPAQVPLRADHDDGLTHPSGLHRGRDCAGRTAVNEEVRLARGGESGEGERHYGQKETANGDDHLSYPLL